MAVYFISDAATGMIKIGHATDPWSRLSNIQSHCPGKLSMLALEEGGEERERMLHEEFAAARCRGEWFAPSDMLITYIAALPPARREKTFKTPKAEMIARLRAATGERFQTVDSWLERGSFPAWHFKAIAAAGIYTLEELAEIASQRKAKAA